MRCNEKQPSFVLALVEGLGKQGDIIVVSLLLPVAKVRVSPLIFLFRR